MIQEDKTVIGAVFISLDDTEIELINKGKSSRYRNYSSRKYFGFLNYSIWWEVTMVAT